MRKIEINLKSISDFVYPAPCPECSRDLTFKKENYYCNHCDLQVYFFTRVPIDGKWKIEKV